jgi:hypothetical protein
MPISIGSSWKPVLTFSFIHLVKEVSDVSYMEVYGQGQGKYYSIQFNLFHPRIIIHDMGQVKD